MYLRSLVFSVVAQLAMSTTAAAVSVVGNDWFQAGTLYDVDLSSGAATNPRSTGLNLLVGIAFPSTATLYGLATSLTPLASALYTIDAATGSKTLVGQTGLEFVGAGDHAFGPTTGMLYGATLSNTRAFFTLDPATGVATIIGSLGFLDISAMAFDSAGTLFVLDTGPATQWWQSLQGAPQTTAKLGTIANLPPEQQSAALEQVLKESSYQLAQTAAVSQYISTQGGRQTNRGGAQVAPTDVRDISSKSLGLVANAAVGYLVSRDALAQRGTDTSGLNVSENSGATVLRAIAAAAGVPVDFAQAGHIEGLQPGQAVKRTDPVGMKMGLSSYALTPDEFARLNTPGLMTQTVVDILSRFNPNFASSQLGQILTQSGGVLQPVDPARAQQMVAARMQVLQSQGQEANRLADANRPPDAGQTGGGGR